jgi:hypothetical protein
MRRATICTAIIGITFVARGAAVQPAKVGEPAPAFAGRDTKGRMHSLSGCKGRWVVLEWHNSGCPYVRKHYGTGNMQKLQRTWTAKGVVWLTVISSAPGMQGHVTGPEADAFTRAAKAAPTATILDPAGVIGRDYDARTTPHMFVINPQGRLVYSGAIDDRPSTDPADVPGGVDYVSKALTEAMAGRPVSRPSTRPYGCSVKYADRGR